MLCIGCIISTIVLLKSKKKDNPIVLETPVVTLQENQAIWNPNPNAEKFEISINNVASFVEKSTTSKKLEEGQSFKVRAIGDGKRYTNSDWSNVVTYKNEENIYTIIWKNGDVVLEIDTDVAEGIVPIYDGEIPTKEPDAQYHYVFAGWTPEVGAAHTDATYTAVFTSVPNTYTIIWKNGDTILETDENVVYGSTPSYDGEIPTKEASEQYTYTFSGWSPQISLVTQSVIYQTQFIETIQTYTVTFYTDDGSTILDKVTVEYGTNATYSKEKPIKNDTEGYTYVFDKWVTSLGGQEEDNLTNVTKDRVVYASFKQFQRTVTVYIVTNNNDYGAVSISVLNDIPYGSAITVDENTIIVDGKEIIAEAKVATDQYSYTFINWTADKTVGNDTILTANFSRTINQYTVTWMNGDKILEIDENVNYGTIPVYNGEMPTKDLDNGITYTFSGWSPVISSVTGNVIYVAQFTNIENKYVVTFYDDDGTTILGVAVVEAGETAVYPNALPVKEATEALTYTFDKWVYVTNGSEEADLTNINTNQSVYAKYNSTTRLYTVTFCDWDGSILDEQFIEYGQPAIPPQELYREGYRFDKWSSSYQSINKDMVISAIYIRQFIVKFLDYDNTIIDFQFIDYGCDAIQPNNPVRKNYKFIGWNTTFTNIVSDLTVKAQYIRQYTVTFVDYDATIIATDVVNSGENATPPSAPNREGYTFISWNKSYNNIISDIEIVAVYEINRYTVTFLDADGSILLTISNVVHGTTVTPPKTADIYFDWNKTKGYRFTGWKDWDEQQPIVGNISITAEYLDEIIEPIIAIETKEISKGTTTAEISVYLCGTFENIYGMSLRFQYAEQLVLSNDSTIVNNKLTGAESMLTTEMSMYELSWADGQGIDVNDRLEVLTLTFSIDKYTNVGEYIMELLEGTYIIDEKLSKVTPIVIVGKIIIME